jgi:hypothetical protein
MKDKFIKWQCHTRQMMMRDNQGRPDAAIMPEVYLAGQDASVGALITILNKLPSYSQTPEMLHMARKTNDPAQARSQAIQFFSATYYQKFRQFSDVLSATFPPGSGGAAQLMEAGSCRLVFEAYAQRFDLDCTVTPLAQQSALYQATMAHNRLFNSGLSSETIVLGFEPDWEKSTATP